MSRATVSAQLQQLEGRLGIRLVQRTTRSVTLTEAGQAYHQGLTGILPQIREAERAAISYQEEAVGRIKITTSPELTQRFLAPIVAEFLKNNPALSIELNLTNETVNLVEQGFDLGIRSTISIEPNLVTRQIGASPIFVCASPDYLARHGTPAHPEELADHACLHFAGLRWGRVWVFHQNDEALRINVMPRLEVNDGQTLRRAAVEGAGVTLLPAFIVGNDIRQNRLVPLFRQWSIATVPLHAVYPANRHIAVKVRRFVAFLAERLSEEADFRET